LVGLENIAVAGETVARPVNLAQASQSRLGETNRDFAQTSLRERSPRRPAQIFDRANILPMREGSRLSEIPRWLLDALSSPRLDEGGSLKRARLA